MKRFFMNKTALTAAILTASGSASAVSIYDPLTAAVNFSEVTTGVIAVAALLAAVLVIKRGVRMLLSFIGR